MLSACCLCRGNQKTDDETVKDPTSAFEVVEEVDEFDGKKFFEKLNVAENCLFDAIPKFSREIESKFGKKASENLEFYLNQRNFSADDLNEIYRLLFGRKLPELFIDSRILLNAEKHKFEMVGFCIGANAEQMRPPRKVKVAAIQNKIVSPTTDPVNDQQLAIRQRIGWLIESAVAVEAQIVCLQEMWSMPFIFGTENDFPWQKFAEDAENGPTTRFLQKLAKNYGIVIVSPILEIDQGEFWNSAVVISNTGKVLGKSRANHLPKNGDFNASTYYGESTLGHPVFETAFGRIAVNIGYGRHHPLNWMMYAMNGAEIVFNPCATTKSISEALWPIEARNAAIANHVFTVAINRVGEESFSNLIEHKGNENSAEFFGSSYVAAPDGCRTSGLSTKNDGILICEMDLNLCRQTKDSWGFKMTQRLDMYAEEISEAAKVVSVSAQF